MKRFDAIKLAVLAGALTIGLALLIYYLNFNEGVGLSADKGEWGAFGDFVGGFSNPVLTFITTCLLISSIALQREANSTMLDQSSHMASSAVRQNQVDELRSFESSFFSLNESVRKEYEYLSLTDSDGLVHTGGAAVSLIEVEIIAYLKECTEKNIPSDIFSFFSAVDERSNMSLFSCVRSFYVLMKFTYDFCPSTHTSRYIDIAVHMTPVKILNLTCLARAYTDWGLLGYLESKGFFNIIGLKEYYETWSGLFKIK